MTEPKTTWQPIETAPKDGTWIVVLIPDPIQNDDGPIPLVETTKWENVGIEYWEDIDKDTKKRIIRDDSHWRNYENPTHWMSIPEPPHDN